MRSLLLLVTGYLLRLVLFAAISAIVLTGIIGDSKHIKTTIADTQAYQRFVPSILDANKANKQPGDTIPYENSEIQAIFISSFPSRDLQYTTEIFIDSIYAWLNNSSRRIVFTADFSRNRTQLAQGLSDFAFKRLAALPPCKTLPSQVNPLTIDCRPTGYNSAEVKQAYTQQLLTDESFLTKTTYTEADLPKTTDNKTIEQKFWWAPRAFSWLKKAPYILGGSLVILAVLYVSLGTRRRKAVASLASILMSAGIGLVVLPILFNYVLPKFTGSLGFNTVNNDTQKIISDITSQLYKDVDLLLIACGATVTVIGGLIYVTERLTRPTSRYGKLSKAGVASADTDQQPSPKSIKNQLTASNIPLITSDQSGSNKNKSIRTTNKYRTLYKKKGL